MYAFASLSLTSALTSSMVSNVLYWHCLLALSGSDSRLCSYFQLACAIKSRRVCHDGEQPVTAFETFQL